MRRIDWPSFRESAESQSKAGRYNPARVVKYRGRRHVLPAGDGDDWFLLKEGERVYCVSINRRLGYCGVQGYDKEDEECDERLSVFLQADYEIEETLGKRGLDLTDQTIARRLIDLLCELTA